jgi:hypothetical protein
MLPVIAGQAADLEVWVGVHLRNIVTLGASIVANVNDGHEELEGMVD